MLDCRFRTGGGSDDMPRQIHNVCVLEACGFPPAFFAAEAARASGVFHDQNNIIKNDNFGHEKPHHQKNDNFINSKKTISSKIRKK